jgi:ankyrin repeat protein
MEEAIRIGGIDSLKTLIKDGADVNKRDDLTGDTPLMYVASSSDRWCLKILLEAGADVNLPNMHGITALMRAAGDSYHCTRLLLEAGADIDVVAKNGLTALRYAIWGIHWKNMKLLVERGANINYAYPTMTPEMFESLSPQGAWMKRKSLLALRDHFLNQDD